jgi:hypothetical protein
MTVCEDRATAPIENIWCEKIRGCSYGEATRLAEFAPFSLDAPAVKSVTRADPREHGAVVSVQHLFYSIRGNAISGSHSDPLGASL